MAEQKVFISPHDDDHALFGAFTCLREHPTLVVVFDGHVQQRRGCKVTAAERAKETELAADILECSRVIRLGFSDADESVTVMDIFNALRKAVPQSTPNNWYLPADEIDGNLQHSMCALLAGFPYSPATTRYLTYTSKGKSKNDKPVCIEHGRWIQAKLQALSVYSSQMQLDPRMGCWEHFLREQTEYYL